MLRPHINNKSLQCRPSYEVPHEIEAPHEWDEVRSSDRMYDFEAHSPTEVMPVIFPSSPFAVLDP